MLPTTSSTIKSVGYINKENKTETAYNEQNYDQIAKVIADIEIINIVKSELTNPTSTVLDMKNINT